MKEPIIVPGKQSDKESHAPISAMGASFDIYVGVEAGLTICTSITLTMKPGMFWRERLLLNFATEKWKPPQRQPFLCPPAFLILIMKRMDLLAISSS